MQLSHKESQREWQIKSKHIRNYDTIIRDGVKPEKKFFKKTSITPEANCLLKICFMVSENRYLEKPVDS